MDDRLEEIATRLDAVAEELAELAIDRLRSAVEQGDTDGAAQERRITRARRAVEKAAAVLHEASHDTSVRDV